MATVSVFALAAAAAAAAQAAPASGAPGTTDESSSNSIQEVIVTANRFAESAQKASLVVSVINTDELKGVTDARQLQSVDPGVQLGGAGSAIQTFIRGVGSLNTNGLAESSVSYNADGVFLYTSTMINPAMYDLERIEVLKGPQGTLYGRNASGGAVNIITRGANLNASDGRLEVEGGNFEERRVLTSLNFPIGETAAIRLAGQHVEHDGYLSDGTDDQNLTAARVRLRWEPTPTLVTQGGFDISTQKSRGAGSSINPNPTGIEFIGSYDPTLIGTPYALGSRPPGAVPHYNNYQWSANAQVDADLGFATLTVLPAYRYEKVDELNYVPGSVSNQAPIVSRQKSVETRLANRSDRLKWVLGAYYFKVDQSAHVIIRNEARFQYADQVLKALLESYAFFGEATVSVTDSVRVIGGLRYTHERSGKNGVTNAFLGPPTAPATAAYNPYNAVTNPTGQRGDYPFNIPYSGSAVTWKGGLEVDVTAQSLVFATVSRGFKGGGAYVDIPSNTDTSYSPEYVTAFELGSRNRFWDNRLQVNGGLFYWKLKDQQLTYTGFNSLGGIALITSNAGKSHMYGANASVEVKPTRADTFSVAAEYLKSNYDTFLRIVPSTTVIAGSACTITTGVAQSRVDCSGLPMIRAPEWSGSASYDHRFDLGSSGDINFNANMTFSSGAYLSPVYTALHRQGAYQLFNSSLTYTTADRAISLSAWIRNIADKRVMLGGNQFANTFSRPTLNAPRTFGVSAGYSF